MIKTFYFKIFTIISFMVLFSLNAFADEKNILTDIIIQPLYNNTYTLNLLFKDEYKGNAFLQKKENGMYSVYIPDVILPDKNSRILYENPNDKHYIVLSSKVKDYISKNKNSSYVQINVNMAGDYSVKLVKDVQSNYPTTLLMLKNTINSTAFMLFLTVLAALALWKIHNKFNETKNNSNSYTSYPVSFKGFKPKSAIKNNSSLHRTKVNNFKNIFKTAQESGFNCFTLPIDKNISSGISEIKSNLKQASSLLLDKTNKMIKLKHTNPITKSYDETSELTMPMVDDINQNKTNSSTLPHISASPKAELLSVLNITVNKGFYLTTVDDTFALFGFINENVFLLEKFNDLSQINLQARFYESNDNGEIYIVRLDNYKAMVEISNSSIKELAKI